MGILELREKYKSLFNTMVESKDVDNMKLFGTVMNNLMEFAIMKDQSFAEQEVEKLEAINWDQYLTRAEAESICKSMDPEGKWTFDGLSKALREVGFEIERKPLFNKYAMWVTMNAMYSDHADRLKNNIKSMTGLDIDQTQCLTLIYGLALDSLLDQDDKFNVRKYFLEPNDR